MSVVASDKHRNRPDRFDSVSFDGVNINITDCAMDDKLLKELTDILSNANGKLQRELFLILTVAGCVSFVSIAGYQHAIR